MSLSTEMSFSAQLQKRNEPCPTQVRGAKRVRTDASSSWESSEILANDGSFTKSSPEGMPGMLRGVAGALAEAFKSKLLGNASSSPTNQVDADEHNFVQHISEPSNKERFDDPDFLDELEFASSLATEPMVGSNLEPHLYPATEESMHRPAAMTDEYGKQYQQGEAVESDISSDDTFFQELFSSIDHEFDDLLMDFIDAEIDDVLELPTGMLTSSAATVPQTPPPPMPRKEQSLKRPSTPVLDEEYHTPNVNSTTSFGSSGDGSVTPKRRKTSKKPPVPPSGRTFIAPTEVDVLFGRGGKTNLHPGNKRFRVLADEFKPRYAQCNTKIQKKAMSIELLQRVHDWAGRFLMEDEFGRYYVAPTNVARKKASQCLRENKTSKKQGEAM